MKKSDYLKDKWIYIFLYIFNMFLFLLLLSAFKVKYTLIMMLLFLFSFFFILLLIIDYSRKNAFYKELLTHIDALDKSYLVLETIKEPSFYEGKLLVEALYRINKSMNEEVSALEQKATSFKEYIELWIHEVKTPIITLALLFTNQNKKEIKIIEQLKKLENDVEQILFYVRSNTPEKDYLIKETSLNKIVKNVALKNKEMLLANKIDLFVENVNCTLYTDSKWLEFILNQIISNSLKYKDKKNAYIKIAAEEEEKKIVLTITDNGMGIPKSDLPRVFEKSFTGINGRKTSSSTGMGLYIVKNLCDKLNIKIRIESEEKHFTILFLEFPKNEYYKVVK